jgi:hypothetical protein
VSICSIERRIGKIADAICYPLSLFFGWFVPIGGLAMPPTRRPENQSAIDDNSDSYEFDPSQMPKTKKSRS